MHPRAVDPHASRLQAGRAANLMEFEAEARRLPRALHHYVAGASEDRATHRRNLRSFRDRAFLPEVLVDVSGRSTETSLFGVRYAAPFGIAPMGFSRQIATDRDVVLTRAAAVGGQDGVAHGLQLLIEEVSRNMGLLGITRPHDVRRIALLRDGHAAG